MRLRIPELLAERGWTVYQLAQRLGDRINRSTVYRLADDDWLCLKREVLDALCDVFEVEPGDLLVREKRRR